MTEMGGNENTTLSHFPSPEQASKPIYVAYSIEKIPTLEKSDPI